ncbi:glycerate kinase [Sphaerisporangium melleum]|uniref:Glycerate kinase n=1 Tax=Sphaerisporangium melleum TaxID=321316 RepID=A0A917RIM2_9ACTN|nr:glycerate kinase [Sphaerisporangium melleum]GGL09376.1 glycerate kinase [Sphaerisporangium melleum]GII67559.1 glycerate kinase [Sphaerisporangium melleum]
MSGHVLVAPDKFKGSLSAVEVAGRVAAGLRAAHPEVEVVTMPVADGGDGTVEAAVACGFRRAETVAAGPTGEPVRAAYALRGDVAVVELAEASGLHRLTGGRLAPLTATSHGTGDLIAAALRHRPRQIVLGLGGSACTDGGSGMVRALGVRLLDARGRELPPGGGALTDLRTLDLSGFTRPAGTAFVVASDVDNPLLGPDGAAAVYGPQKGAGPDELPRLEEGLAHWADVAERELGVRLRDAPGAGAAGGVGFAALAFLGARVRPGIGLLLDLLGFADRLAGARLVVTGEGSLDEQTLRGKAPAGVAEAAGRAGVPVVAVCGRRTLTGEQLRAAGIQAAFALTDIEADVRRCMAEAGPLLERLAATLVADRLPEVPAHVRD